MTGARTHGSTIEDGPQGAPNTERRTADDGETNVVDGTDATSQGDEETGNRIADPDTEPCLPPGEAVDDHGGGNHPRVDVEGVGDPETDEVPGTPLAALLFDGLQVMVGELRASVSTAIFLAARAIELGTG